MSLSSAKAMVVILLGGRIKLLKTRPVKTRNIIFSKQQIILGLKSQKLKSSLEQFREKRRSPLVVHVKVGNISIILGKIMQ